MNLDQEIQKINQYILADQFKGAYKLCNTMLLNFPESRRLHKLQYKIEKIAFKQNVESVKKDLKALKPLWEEKGYKELVEKLEVLQSYVPGYKSVEKDLYKASKLYQKQMIIEQKDFLEKYMKAIEVKMSEKNFREAIILLKKVLDSVQHYKRAESMIEKAKDLLIDQELEKNQDLLQSKKFKEIEILLKKLLDINPESSKIKSIYKKAAKRETLMLEFAKKDFTYQSYGNILVLYQKKKYEKAIDSLYELLSVDPDNVKAKELLLQAEKKFDSKLTKDVVVKITELQKKYENQYREDKKAFVRI